MQAIRGMMAAPYPARPGRASDNRRATPAPGAEEIDMTDSDATPVSAEKAAEMAEFTANMAKVMERSQSIWMRMMQASMDDPHPIHGDPLNTLPAFGSHSR